MSPCHIHASLQAKWPTGDCGPLYARQEQSLRSPVLPLASACCSPPPQKFLQLMGNPTASCVSRSPGVGWGRRPRGAVPLAHTTSPVRGLALPLGEQHLVQWGAKPRQCWSPVPKGRCRSSLSSPSLGARCFITSTRGGGGGLSAGAARVSQTRGEAALTSTIVGAI